MHSIISFDYDKKALSVTSNFQKIGRAANFKTLSYVIIFF